MVRSHRFGELIKLKRRECNYSQRELAKLIGINYTYLSKLESDSADYPPSQKVIVLLATHLNLDADELRRLAGRLNAEEEEIFQDLCRQYPQMSKLLQRMKHDPDFARKAIELAVEDEDTNSEETSELLGVRLEKDSTGDREPRWHCGIYQTWRD